MNKKVIACLLLLSTCLCLDIAINSQDYKCMVVYTNSQNDHLKIDIKFPKLKADNSRNYYEILLTNTETETSERHTIEHGTFRKEIQLTENVVYKLCVKIILSGRGQVQQYMTYNTGVQHSTSIYSQHIQVPKSLLKISDLHQSYKELLFFKYELDHLNQTHNASKEIEETIFTTQNQKIKKIEFISFIQLGAIIVLGAYQFISLKSIIQNRHK